MGGPLQHDSPAAGAGSIRNSLRNRGGVRIARKPSDSSSQSGMGDAKSGSRVRQEQVVDAFLLEGLPPELLARDEISGGSTDGVSHASLEEAAVSEDNCVVQSS